MLFLFLFLIVAAYHFGKEDTGYFLLRENFGYQNFLFFLKGSSVIIAPLLLQRNKTNEIFEILEF